MKVDERKGGGEAEEEKAGAERKYCEMKENLSPQRGVSLTAAVWSECPRVIYGKFTHLSAGVKMPLGPHER